MRTAKFTIETSSNGSPCIQGHDLSEEQAQVIRSVVTNNLISHEEYKLKTGVQPFLQGYNVSHPESCRVLVEFWSRNREACQRWVDYVNAKLGL